MVSFDLQISRAKERISRDKLLVYSQNKPGVLPSIEKGFVIIFYDLDNDNYNIRLCETIKIMKI